MCPRPLIIATVGRLLTPVGRHQGQLTMTLDSPPTRRRSFQFGIKEMAISIALMAAALSMLRAWCLLFERAWGTRYAEWLMDASPIASTVISCCACTSIGVLLHSVKSDSFGECCSVPLAAPSSLSCYPVWQPAEVPLGRQHNSLPILRTARYNAVYAPGSERPPPLVPVLARINAPAGRSGRGVDVRR